MLRKINYFFRYISILFVLLFLNTDCYAQNKEELLRLGISEESLWKMFSNSACQPGLNAANDQRFVDAIRLWADISPYKILSEQYYAVNKCLILTKVTESDAEIREWYKMAALHGATEAEILLAFDYYMDVNISGVEREKINTPELRESIAWAQRAVNHGIPEAKAFLSLSYLDGLGVKKDINYGVKLLFEAAQEGSLSATEDIIGIYRYGKYGYKVDSKKEIYWCSYAGDLANKLKSKLTSGSKCTATKKLRF